MGFPFTYSRAWIIALSDDLYVASRHRLILRFSFLEEYKV